MSKLWRSGEKIHVVHALLIALPEEQLCSKASGSGEIVLQKMLRELQGNFLE